MMAAWTRVEMKGQINRFERYLEDRLTKLGDGLRKGREEEEGVKSDS